MSRYHRVVCDLPTERRPAVHARALVQTQRPSPWQAFFVLILLWLALLATACDGGPLLAPPRQDQAGAAARDSLAQAALARADEFVALAFSDNETLLRWETPLRVSIPAGSAADSAIALEVLSQIGEITGKAPQLGADGNVVLEFLPPAQTPCGIDACWAYPTQPPLTWGHVWVSSQLAPGARRGAVRVILASVMGLGGYSHKPESLFNANGNGTNDFSQLDRWVFRALYERSLHAGMTREEAHAAVLKLP